MKYWRVNKMEIKNWKEMYSKPKEVSEKELKQLRKKGKVYRCPDRKVKGSKNARWGWCE
jgi:hypothetical protein|tara:strand:+ start:931 stop:1107 length:177 start_codon:yes stop_codon:yes gene_type:complete